MPDLSKPIAPPPFGDRGDVSPLPASRPLVLDGGGSIWQVVEGAAEIFGVELDASGAASGKRRHLLTVRPGDLLFGAAPDRSAQHSGLLAVGQARTSLRALSFADLDQAARSGESGMLAVVKLVETWLRGLTQAALLHAGIRPESNVVPVAGTALPRKRAANVGRPENLVWLPGPLEGNFFGLATVTHDDASVAFPLAPEAWFDLSPAPGTTLTPLTTSEVLGRGDLAESLALFHEAFLEIESLGRSFLGVDELLRRDERSRHSGETGVSSWERIASVLGTTNPDTETRGTGEFLSDIGQVMTRAGRVQGISFEIPLDADARELTVFFDGVGRIASNSNVRWRKVALGGNWWKQENGPLVTFHNTTGKALALMPCRPRNGSRYEAVYADGTHRPVDADLAPELHEFAASLYRSFPAGKISLRQLVAFAARGVGGELRLVAMMALAVGLLGLLNPWFTGQIFEDVIPGAERSLLLQYALGLTAAALATAAFELVRGYALLRLETRGNTVLQAAVWDRLILLPTAFFRRFAAGDLANRANGITEIRTAFSQVGVTVLMDAPVSALNVLLMLWYNWQLALAAIGVSFFGLLVMLGCNLQILQMLKRQFAVAGAIEGLVFQIISGVAKLRVSGAENMAFSQWTRLFSEQKRISYRVGLIDGCVQVLFSAMPSVATMVIFWCFVYLQELSSGKGDGPVMATGSFIAFNAAFGTFVAALVNLSSSSLMLLSVFPLFERLKPILEATPETDAAREPPGQLQGGIDIRNVSFRYRPDTPPILDRISLRIGASEYVAIVGPSGSGKSTLLRLLLGFETPASGSIFLDGRDTQSLDMRAARRQMGVVLQSSRLFPGDIYRNIIGDATLPVEDAWWAAAAAGLDTDIQRMPMGMYTVISEGGASFSGGQKQRLMIARAVVRRPRILFFDEATSALDNRTQAIVSESLEKLNATRIVIAHRLSTIRHANRIVVLEAGKITEEGTYEELMALNGPFAALARRQQVEEA